MIKKDFKFSLKWIAITIGLSFLAFKHPEKGDLIELSDWLSGRSSGFFRAIDQNRIKVLPPGTRGRIKKVKVFSHTKNYGVCVDISAQSSNSDCVWIYYNRSKPKMVLFKHKSKSDHRPILTTDPKEAKIAKTTEVVQAIQDAPQPPDSDAVQDSDDTSLKTAIQNIDNLNNQGTDALRPDPVCSDCAPKMSSYPRCTVANSYQESTLEQILSSAKYSAIYQGKQTEIIKPSCIQRALETSSSGGGLYKRCDAGDTYARKTVVRACTSENYVELVSKSFNAVANCLGDFVSGSKTTKSEASLMLFSLLSLESGLNTNAVSPTGAAGPGQMTSSAITAVNKFLPNVRDFLSQSENPQCSEVLAKVIDTPMNSSRSRSCDRISLHKENPLKNLIYTFALQSLTRKFVNEEFERRTYANLLDSNLSSLEKERLLSSLAAWSHNTGVAGMIIPLRVLLSKYVRSGQKISTASDVTKFLKELSPVMKNHPHGDNSSSGRRRETSKFFSNVNNRMKSITSEPTSCLAQ